MTTPNQSILTPYIKSLFLDPPNLTPSDLSMVLKCIFRGIPSDIQTAAFLTALRMRGLDHEPDYVAAAATTILEFSTPIPLESLDPKGYVDVVGTGGDGQNTFNVSTSAAIVAAGMGLSICKHGGKASTSSSGSGDLLKSLGIDLMQVTHNTTAHIVKKSKFCFLFAPVFHPGMAQVAHIRSQLGVPTIFNILGPLINPIPLRARILGVYSEKLGESYAKAASALALENKIHERTMVVYGEVGLDEISPIGSTKCWIIESDGSITRLSISPEDFGLPEHQLNEVKSGSPEENASILLHILRQDSHIYKLHESEKGNHPIVDYILLNSAALAVVSGLSKSWAEGVKLAKNSITSGAALQSLEDFKSAISEVS
ncbi:uncharacterized protein PRCAT00000783001 [Priceomyces carsonii]|uniref:uncharacterized protein n=1 Tax=Priceomyces carsonii TaxID=28549 RepID=UPI002ED7B41C|nr:unnamed protein product [Priceomyces carsonii]